MSELADHELMALVLALGIGLLIGLERERTGKVIGVRSFALVAILGCVGGLAAAAGASWVPVAGLIAVAALMAIHTANVAETGPGLTTVTAVLVVYVIGTALALGERTLAVVAGGLVFALLHWKDPLHWIADRLGERDLAAITTLALMSMVVLPVLPDRAMGWFNAFNPFETWLMVVLIVSINLAGYAYVRIAGHRGGALLSGLLGGVVSSTATTVSASSEVGRNSLDSQTASTVILLASAVVYLRILLEVSIVTPELLVVLAAPVTLVGLVVLLVGMVSMKLGDATKAKAASARDDDAENPAQLKTALVFGALYALISLGVGAARDWLGSEAVYLVAIVSGLVDVDAITLSTAQFFRAGRLDAGISWRVILLASLSNLLFKSVLAGVLGGPALARCLLLPITTAVGTGIAVVTLWP